jgi:hypothetical protein
LLVSVPMISYLLYRLKVVYDKMPELSGAFMHEIIYFLNVFLVLFISYWVFWNLIRIPLFNKIFTYTTLTHYYRRYHQPETRLKQMASM